MCTQGSRAPTTGLPGPPRYRRRRHGVDGRARMRHRDGELLAAARLPPARRGRDRPLVQPGYDFTAVAPPRTIPTRAIGAAVSSSVTATSIKNICTITAGFAHFFKGARAEPARPGYQARPRRNRRAHARSLDRGATEVCRRSIHPSFTGHTYLEHRRGLKTGRTRSRCSVLALEVSHGARTWTRPSRFLQRQAQGSIATIYRLGDSRRRSPGHVGPDKLSRASVWLS